MFQSEKSAKCPNFAANLPLAKALNPNPRLAAEKEGARAGQPDQVADGGIWVTEVSGVRPSVNPLQKLSVPQSSSC